MALTALQRSIQQGFETHAPACIPLLSSSKAVAVSAALTAYQMYRGSFVGTLLTGALLLSSGSLYQTEQVSPENVGRKLKDLWLGIGESLKRNDFQEALFTDRFNKVREVLAPMQASFTEAEVSSQNKKMTEIATLITSPTSRAIWQIDGLDLEMKMANEDGTFEAKKQDFTNRYNAVNALYSQYPNELAGKKGVLQALYQMIVPARQLAAPNPTQVTIDSLQREIALAKADGSFLAKQGDFNARYSALHSQIEALVPQSRDLLRPKLVPIYQILIVPASAASLQSRAAPQTAVAGAAAPTRDFNLRAIPALAAIVRDARANKHPRGDLQLERYEHIMDALNEESQIDFRQANFKQVLLQICNKMNVSAVAIEEGDANSFAERSASGQTLVAIVPAEGSATWLYHLSPERNRLFKPREWAIGVNGSVADVIGSNHSTLEAFGRNPENTGRFYGVYTNHPATFPRDVYCPGSIPNRRTDANGGESLVYPKLVSALYVLAKILPADLSA